MWIYTMDTIKISLWLFLVLSSANLSKSKSVTKYLVPNGRRSNSEFDENCFCFKTLGEYKKVPEIMNQDKDNLNRIVVYLYEYKNTGQIKMYVPNKEKQALIPDLAFEVGDKLNTIGVSTAVKYIFDMNSPVGNSSHDLLRDDETVILHDAEPVHDWSQKHGQIDVKGISTEDIGVLHSNEILFPDSSKEQSNIKNVGPNKTNQIIYLDNVKYNEKPSKQQIDSFEISSPAVHSPEEIIPVEGIDKNYEYWSNNNKIPSENMYIVPGSNFISSQENISPVEPLVIYHDDQQPKKEFPQKVKTVDDDETTTSLIDYVIGYNDRFDQQNKPISEVQIEGVIKSDKPLYIDNNINYDPNVALVKPVVDHIKVLPIEQYEPGNIINTGAKTDAKQNTSEKYVDDVDKLWQIKVITGPSKTENDPNKIAQDFVEVDFPTGEIGMPEDGQNNYWNSHEKVTIISGKQDPHKDTIVVNKEEAGYWNISPEQVVVHSNEHDPNIATIKIDKQPDTPWNTRYVSPESIVPVEPWDPHEKVTIISGIQGPHKDTIVVNKDESGYWNISPEQVVHSNEHDPNKATIKIDGQPDTPWNTRYVSPESIVPVEPLDPHEKVTIISGIQGPHKDAIVVNKDEGGYWNISPEQVVVHSNEHDPNKGTIKIDGQPDSLWNTRYASPENIVPVEPLDPHKKVTIISGIQGPHKDTIVASKEEGGYWNISPEQVIVHSNEHDPNKATIKIDGQPDALWNTRYVEQLDSQYHGQWNVPHKHITVYGDRPSTIHSVDTTSASHLHTPSDPSEDTSEVEQESDEVPFILDISNEVVDNDNEYQTFDKWFAQQMTRFKTYTELDRNINILTIERYILKILNDNDMHVTAEGVLADSFGTALDVHKLQLRPILIGNTVALGKLLKEKATELVMPANMAYLQAILVTNSDPSLMLGIIPIGKTLIPSATNKAFSEALEPYVLNSVWGKMDHHTSPKKFQSIKYTGVKTNYKDIIAKPGGKIRKGKTIITVVKKTPNIIKLHHSYRQPARTIKVVRTTNSGDKEYVLSEDSAEAMNKLIASIQEGNDPIKSAEATNQLLASLRGGEVSMTLTSKSSEEEDTEDDLSERIVGGNAATSSGVPLNVKGRMKDI